VLGAWLELPNLYSQARRSLTGLLGITVLGFPATRAWRCWLAAYGLVSIVYRWVVTVAVLWMAYRFLKPHGLQALGLIAGGGSLSFITIAPLVSWCRAVGKGPVRWKAMNARRLLISLGVFVALFSFFVFVPLPI